jgi:hypothetical protein
MNICKSFNAIDIWPLSLVARECKMKSSEKFMEKETPNTNFKVVDLGENTL